MVFLEGLANFTAVGSGQLRHYPRCMRGDDPAFLANTAWTLQVVRGVGLWLAACALGIPYAWFYKQPILMVLIPVVGLTVLIDSFDSSAMHWCVRHMKLERVTLLEFLRQLSGFSESHRRLERLDVAVRLGVHRGDNGGLCSGADPLALGGLRRPAEPLLFPSGGRARTQFHFGKWIFVNSALDFTARQLDVLLFQGPLRSDRSDRRLWTGDQVSRPAGVLESAVVAASAFSNVQLCFSQRPAADLVLLVLSHAGGDGVAAHATGARLLRMTAGTTAIVESCLLRPPTSGKRVGCLRCCACAPR